jgi:hypothetical protein
LEKRVVWWGILETIRTEKVVRMVAFNFCSTYSQNVQIKEDETGGECSTQKISE